jgi:hypothetical protein
MIKCHMYATSPRDPVHPHPYGGLDYVQTPRSMALARGAGVSPHTRLRCASRKTCTEPGGETGPHRRGPPPHLCCSGGLLMSKGKPPRLQAEAGRGALTES